ncbi:NADPH:quinone reductase-like Zn-dependent oxidoreductase [Paenibacillus polymyxa]|nr:NADPH:quinone reductase-like Zn-dependent oxidoreductase [Paenibacillus polymyxa]
MAVTFLNPIDWKLRKGYLKQMMDWEFPIILGWDVAGTISEVGSEVTDWKVGDEVFARPDTTRFGTYAEYTLVDDHLLTRKPDSISWEEAASVPLAGLTVGNLYSENLIPIKPNGQCVVKKQQAKFIHLLERTRPAGCGR